MTTALATAVPREAWRRLTLALTGLLLMGGPAIAQDTVAAPGVQLSCELAQAESRLDASSDTHLNFRFDASRLCVNNRTAYTRTPGGFERYVALGDRPAVVRNRFDSRLTRFSQAEFALKPAEWQAWKTIVKQYPPCASSLLEAEAAAVESNVGLAERVSRLPRAVQTVRTWTCSATSDMPQ